MDRRTFLKLTSLATVASALAPAVLRAQGAAEVRIGYQKTGVLVIARQQGTVEKRFASEGVQVKWVEFTSGPPMMEAISNGAVDFGAVGDSPPIFAQAANANIVYAAASPISNGQGVLVPQGSSIKTISDLKGKRVGFTKGSSAHNVVILDARESGPDLQRYHAGLPHAAGCRSCVCQWQYRCMGGVGPIFRHRREEAERPHSHQCV